jgi:hypothetical protein
MRKNGEVQTRTTTSSARPRRRRRPAMRAANWSVDIEDTLASSTQHMTEAETPFPVGAPGGCGGMQGMQQRRQEVAAENQFTLG